VTDFSLVRTPFGRICLLRAGEAPRAAVLLREEDLRGGQRGERIRAAIYGAKQMGIERIVDIVPARPLDRLLPEGGYALPHDVVDLTRGQYLTFFEHKGYGFLPMHTPFCPELRAALLPGVRAINPLSAARGIVAALDGWEQIGEAQRWGAHIAAVGVSPAVFLARELELCYVALCVPDAAAVDYDDLIDDMLTRLPAERTCPCGTAMQATRQRGLVGDDWREWL
jgi:5'-methylthioadenosine phosphorylase